MASAVFAALLLAHAVTIATAAPQRADDDRIQRPVPASVETTEAATITRAGMFFLIAGGLVVVAIVGRASHKVVSKRGRPQRRSRRPFEADPPTVVAAARRAAPPFPLPHSPSDYAGAQARSNQTSEAPSDPRRVDAGEDGAPGWPLLKTHIGRAYGQVDRETPPHVVLIWSNDATPGAFVIHLLRHVFEQSEDDTREIMIGARNFGVGVCALYGEIEDAEAKIAVARALVHQHGHRLELTLLAVV